jgi:cell division protease FtsH
MTGLAWVLPIVLIGGLLLFASRRSSGGPGPQTMQFARSRARRIRPSAPRTTFTDVAGCDEAIMELQEIRDFLASPRKYRALGARIPRGVLLVGPPGTGKTLLARAVAGEAGAPFFSISGSEFVEMFVGIGASRVRDLFQQAKQQTPCIVFIDEIDAVGRARGTGMSGGNDEREQTLNQLLVEMDGFEVNDAVIVMAATNRVDTLDPALLRPGRFDRHIAVERPDRAGRRAILELHARGKPLAGDVDLDVLAGATPGFTGAELANLVNEAALIAARRCRSCVGRLEMEEGMMRVIAGEERARRVLSAEERRITAYHEVGHALVGHLLAHCDAVQKISIVSRGRALGFTLAVPEDERFLTKRSALEDQMAMLLGGRTAEELMFGEVTTGAADDLQRATRMAEQMVTRLGMSERVGPRVIGDPDEPAANPFRPRGPHSEQLAERVDHEVYRVLGEAHRRARQLLETHREQLETVAETLLERETLNRDEFERLLAGGELDPPVEEPDPSVERQRKRAPRPTPQLQPQPALLHRSPPER